MFSITVVSLLAAVASVSAHMDVQSPAPLRSKFNTLYADGNIDYNMLSPLASDGSNFPCKGYQTDVPSVSGAVTTLKAGEPLTVQMEGSATHGGGSCQFSLSYDNGKTFGVIKSIVGGCPLSANYTVDIPADVPSGSNALLSWTWFNKVGNREMYQNCIAVDIAGKDGGSIELPKMFEANIGNGCTTVEGTEVDFANPKAMVTGCDNPITTSQKVTLTGSGAPSSGGDSSSTDAPSSTAAPSTSTDAPSSTTSDAPAPTETEDPCPGEGEGEGDDSPTDTETDAPEPTETDDPCPGEDDSTSTDAPASTDAPTSTDAPSDTAAPAPTATATDTPTTGSDGCVAGAFKCSADGLSWSMCANGQYLSMGAVAPGTKCADGKMVPLASRARRQHRYRRLARNH
jgi:hypothetical protein